MRSPRDSWLNPALALALGAIGGAAFARWNTPLPWMIGPLLVMAFCNFGGARLRSPWGDRQVGQWIVGTALGLYFTPLVAREVLAYWPVLLFAAAFSIVVASVCAWLLVRLTDTDRSTAFFASVPGGAAEMAVLGDRYGARVDRIALAQSLRILVVVIVVPSALTYSGAHGTDLYAPIAVPFDAGKLALLLAMGAVAGGILTAAKAPNPFMFGPLLVTILLTAQDLQFSTLPAWGANLGQLLLGCALGSRFERQFLAGLGRYAGAVLASILLALALAAGLGLLISKVVSLPAPSLMLALAPGGIAEMCITAKVLQLGVPLVTAAHVTRVLILINASGPIYRLFVRRR